MEKMQLWDEWNHWKQECRWVDLTHPLGAETPHWVGWPCMAVEEKSSLKDSLFCAHSYTTVGQYGTHADAPSHMVKDGRTLDQIEIQETVMPLCVIDARPQVKENDDFTLGIADILSWEKKYGRIPEGAFVAFLSDWSKRPAEQMDNLDAQGNRHFPGWKLEAVKFLVEERNIGAIGHETSDTEAPITSGKTNYEVEYYILAQNRIQIELLTNLDQCPAVGSLIFCTFPKLKGGSGYPARCFALCPKE